MKPFLVFALVFPTLAVFSYFHPSASPSTTQIWYTASKFMQFSLPILALILGAKKKWSLKISWDECKIGLLLGLGMLASLLILYFSLRSYPFLEEVKFAILVKLVSFGAATPFRYAMLALFLCVVHSFLEEFYWRGFVYAELQSWLGTGKAIVLSSLGFMGHHVVVIYAYCPQNLVWILVPVFSLFVFAAGIAWCCTYLQRQSLVGAWLSHLLADVAILLIGYHLVFAGGTP